MRRHSWAAAAVLVLGSMLATVMPASASPATTTQITHLAVPAVTAATKTAAEQIKTLAQLEAAPAAVRAYIQAPAEAVTTTTPPPTKPTLRPDAHVGEGGCANVITNTEELKNAFGWVLAATNLGINNWCWVYNLYGYWVIYTTPNSYYHWATHWGYAYCGVAGYYHDWVSVDWEWEASISQLFWPGECIYPGADFRLNNAYEVYGNGTGPNRTAPVKKGD